MYARLFAMLMVATMLVSIISPAVSAEGTNASMQNPDSDGRHLLADPPDCADWEGVDALEVAKTLEITTEALKEAAPRDLVLGAVVAGEGEVSTDGPNPLYVLAYVAFKAAQEAVVVIEMNHERYLECENGAHWELLRLVDDNLNSLTTTVETNDAALQSSIDTLTAIVEADDSETLRVEIENALYPCVPLVAFYLPTANGGQLETVASVVDTGINDSEAAGFNVDDARSTYNNAITTMNQGAYRDAFIGFCAAYSQLVASSGGGNVLQIPETEGSGYIYGCVNRYTGTIRRSSNANPNPPAVDPSTLCTSIERPIEMIGWSFVD